MSKLKSKIKRASIANAAVKVLVLLVAAIPTASLQHTINTQTTLNATNNQEI